MRNLLFVVVVLCLLWSCTPERTNVATAFNEQASAAAVNGFDPLTGKVVNVYINPGAHTTSVLYAGGDSVLSLVTWRQKPDERWFGAQIPDTVLSVEVVHRQAGAGGGYTYYAGNPLQQAAADHPAERTAWMLAQQQVQVP